MKKPTRVSKRKRSLAAPAILFAALLPGCESIALMPRPSVEAPDAAKSVTATVNGLDHQRREIYLRTGNNQHYVVNYTDGTRVTDRSGDYAVNHLRIGDRVRVELREGTGRRLMADEIRLESAGAPGATGMRTVEGTVERILPERGFFELRSMNGELLTVYMPESSSAETRSRFNRIRVGDMVRLEGERLSENRLELLAFR